MPPTAVVYTETVALTAVPTDTVPAGEPTSTPEPRTDTPEPLPTPTPIPAGKDLTQQRMLLRTMPDKKTFAQTDGPVTSASATYDATFDFNSGNVNVKLRNHQINLGTVPLVSAEKWLFVGYQVVNGTNTIQSDFSDLVIQRR